MILVPGERPTLWSVVRRAARPDEDVFREWDDVADAVLFGFPRLLVCRRESESRIRGRLPGDAARVPVLALGAPTLRRWASAWADDGLAVDRIDDSALRLRRLMDRTTQGEGWVEEIFSDLTQTLGTGLPEDLRGFSRRILEFPGRYSSLETVGSPFGLSAGALKARFRRRGLPSPSLYVRWFRLLAASRILADPETTTLSASMRLGFASDGNFCRWVRATSGLSPSALRAWNSRLLLLVRMVDACFPPGVVERWGTLRGLFLRRVA